MSYTFHCYGHPNILGVHKNTLEFTKDDHLTLQGDCIIGVKADFDLLKLKKFISGREEIAVKIEVDGSAEEVNCRINHDFNSASEIVIRKSEFNSRRTLGVRAEKACIDLNRKMIERMKDPDTIMKVTLE